MVTVTRLSGQLLKYGVLSALLLVMVFPMLWMFRVSLMPPGSSIALSEMFGTRLTMSNFGDLFSTLNMGQYLFNSIAVAVVVTAANILFCFMVAYALARFRSLFNKLLFFSAITVLMIPAHVIIIPLYVICLKTGIYDSYWALILPWLVNPIGIFLLKQYIEAIPPAMEEAARVDGAGDFTVLFSIMMPVCRPVLAVLAIQVFVTNWNSFLFPFILTSRESLRTLPVALALFQGHQAIDWQHLMAGASVAVLPILILFVVLQRQIVSGITAGAIKQ
ncbi:MAG: carbohydrate ABC transporter permease [Candidatus Zixiibacteriota bacterium]